MDKVIVCQIGDSFRTAKVDVVSVKKIHATRVYIDLPGRKYIPRSHFDPTNVEDLITPIFFKKDSVILAFSSNEFFRERMLKAFKKIFEIADEIKERVNLVEKEFYDWTSG